ncbi:MAG: alanine racemase [Eubacteriales bacterium]
MKQYVVETELLQQNLRILREKAGEATVWAVLKGNGYGLGTGAMAKYLASQGISHFCVTEIDEAVALRKAGITNNTVLMLRPITSPTEIRTLLELSVIFSISSQDDAIVLNAMAQEQGAVAEAHLKIDVGMGRYGFFPKEVDAMESIYKYMESIAISGVYTHFPCGNGKEKVMVAQFEQFRYVLNQLEAKKLAVETAHCCNSAAFLRFEEMHLSGVRLGSALLGRVRVKDTGLRPVGYCETKVDELKWLPKGHGTGYGAAWVAKKPTKIAVLPVGWHHGFTVEFGRDTFRIRDCIRGMASWCKAMILRKKLFVTINGVKCPVLGHIGMLHTVVDVSAIDCAVGDIATMAINPTMVRGMEVVFR